MKMPLVAANDHGIRPVGKPNECFYCHQKVGQQHKPACVIVKKKVQIKAVILLDIDVPHRWDEEDINFYYNKSTWCADNIVEMIQSNTGKEDDDGGAECLCDRTEIMFVKEVDDTPRIPENETRTGRSNEN